MRESRETRRELEGRGVGCRGGEGKGKNARRDVLARTTFGPERKTLDRPPRLEP